MTVVSFCVETGTISYDNCCYPQVATRASTAARLVALSVRLEQTSQQGKTKFMTMRTSLPTTTRNKRRILPLLLCFVLVGCASAMATPSYNKRVALVTGANKGIGKEIVRLLSEEEDDEWIILLGSRDPGRGEAAVKELLAANNSNQKIICCPLDLTDPKSIQTAQELVEKVGEGTLDVLINNAAICFNDPTLYGKMEYTPFEQQADITIKTNFFGTVQVTQAMLPFLQKSNYPARIINIASSAGRLAQLQKSPSMTKTFTSPNLQFSQLESIMNDFVQSVQEGTHASKGFPNTCYGMSKCGLIAWTRLLARDYPELSISSVDPGYCATDQNNHQGVIPAERGAVTPVLLATLPSEKARNCSGKHFFQEQEIVW